MQPLSVPQPQITQLWLSSGKDPAALPHFPSLLQRQQQQHPRAAPDPRHSSRGESRAGESGSCAQLTQTAPSGSCLDTGSTLALPPLTRCYWADVARVCKMSLVKSSIFFWHCFSFFKKKTHTHTKDKKWLLFVSQCTEHRYFAEKGDIYQQMKQRQAKENRILFMCHYQEKKKRKAGRVQS